MGRDEPREMVGLLDLLSLAFEKIASFNPWPSGQVAGISSSFLWFKQDSMVMVFFAALIMVASSSPLDTPREKHTPHNNPLANTSITNKST